MIYDKKRKFKKSGLMLLTSMFLVSSIIPYFGNMNKVEARITSNLPKSYMSDDFPDSYKPYINSLKMLIVTGYLKLYIQDLTATRQ